MGQCLSSIFNLIRYSSVPTGENDDDGFEGRTNSEMINNNNNNNKGYEFSSTALTSSSSYVEDDENNNLESSIVVVVDDNNYPIPFSEEMSQSTVQIQNDMSGGSCDDDDVSNIVSGHGLAIAEVAVDQDYSYWEWHIIKKCGPDSTSNNDIVSIAAAAECKIGLSIARNQKFYEILKGDGNATSLVLATKLMRSFGSLLNGDTVGVYVDLKSQPKSIQLYRNGVKVDDFDLKRFRGKVYPAIWLPPPDETYTIKLINREREFKHYDKTSMNNKNSANFSPLHNEHSKGGDWVV
uniref:B30.2/SPRY domain-containing protein n=1 Tax=Eucampia antarctica TaxID=49252 RepID=A0A7S2R1B1_9STRA|mmetsp:Transcript_12446/g.12047  ORF Transcript_12446/g.12047 Transcript_12446/m.12047 type:complete len:294 (+) Transcript_12446:165-1046(+)|eukprot:CAMPEP_0197823932 /NCGR_PEP_ID=MMETSP1437-20131217/1250_1 /TAXON_ID=49252 ORGANISM="Eucampia antarctica, Strain CCMP1452" /NCGR_SAMPLE_ID=MMETSP1437 /ASSEMBLY_ACC=CAM_ASM_001096 /LENGTH=293 /DNA_ID=CAMNT_0043423345 /DNA_START=160 /DNA_END=1041 /DNA_ORIENTATION=-